MNNIESFVNCEKCGEQLPSNLKKYCSRFCKMTAKNKRRRYKPQTIGTGNRGAVSELLASVDLLEKGFEVFRSLSPNCSCDLIIQKDNKLQRVEVRTGFVYKEKIAVSRKIRADILAIVLPKGKIIYEPNL